MKDFFFYATPRYILSRILAVNRTKDTEVLHQNFLMQKRDLETFPI